MAGLMKDGGISIDQIAKRGNSNPCFDGAITVLTFTKWPSGLLGMGNSGVSAAITPKRESFTQAATYLTPLNTPFNRVSSSSDVVWNIVMVSGDIWRGS